MLLIGCDFHPRFQQIAMVDSRTGEMVERRWEHPEEARRFYAGLAGPARVGREATGPAQWFERMLREGGHELWVGDAAEMRARVVRQQKTDSRDALPLLDLLRRDRFPRIWIPAVAERDARQLLRHRCMLVRFRTSVENQWQALARGEGVCRRKKLWTKVGRKEREGLALGPGTSRRREELRGMLEQLHARTAELDQAVKKEAESRPAALLRMQQPGVGPVTALALVLTIGPGERFHRSQQVGSDLGLNPRESSSGGRQRLGSIRKQGNSRMRYGRHEAAQTASQCDPEWRRD